MRYKRIFLYGSMQFCGHIEEYFARETLDLLVYVVQPRVGEHRNFARRYHAGVLLEERVVRSSQNPFLYYALWYLNHLRLLLNFSRGSVKTLVLGGHPIAFWGSTLLRLCRPLTFAYWVGDYFPPITLLLRLFEALKKHLQKRVEFAFYLSDAINRVMNDGRVVNTERRRTVMWGLKPYPRSDAPKHAAFTLLFVGLIKPGQGVERLLDFLATHHDYRLSLIGVGQADYIEKLRQQMVAQNLTQQVLFPNRFFPEEELLAEARRCHVGVALYDTHQHNFTHYADPGKVKAYAEMRLPLVMTRISDIAPIVAACESGEVIDDVTHLPQALERIKYAYSRYQAGVDKFIARFEYLNYYAHSFKALESCWRE